MPKGGKPCATKEYIEGLTPENCTHVNKPGRKGGHKGRMRQYTSPEEIDAQIKAEHEKAQEADFEEGTDGASKDPTRDKKDQSSDDSDEDDDYQQKRKGVEGLIDIENPNRAAQTSKKVAQVDLDGPRELSRREREEIEKQKAKERYMKMHLAGKTDQAKADLARLAIIRKQREEAAKKKEEEKKGKLCATKEFIEGLLPENCAHVNKPVKDAAGVAVRGLQSMSLNK